MRRLLIGGLSLLGVIGGTPAAAGVYADELTKCLVAKASTADHEALVRWMFAAFAAGPAVKQLANITPEQRTSVTATAGSMFTRLLTQDCRSETIAALKYEGATAMETGFSALGTVAARDLMTDPAVQAELGKLDAFTDTAKIDAMRSEALKPAKK
ncbi:hypothetical protein [Sphingomonas sp.]|uniref:hypothetical protein n=1 Tax=Sphingomonas sp. TaxID=28214 RepID=UPI003B3A2D1B